MKTIRIFGGFAATPCGKAYPYHVKNEMKGGYASQIRERSLYDYLTTAERQSPFALCGGRAANQTLKA
jgi:hypothetical protein